MEFIIPDMSCGGCANAVTRAVVRLDPAAKLDVDVAGKIVKIASALSPQQLIATIEAAGFHPSLRT
jgi:copper chaperone